MMLEHLGEKPTADRLMLAVEAVTANSDLGGNATTRLVTDAIIYGRND
jgi:tartrate dehydrogenase/decarboxylase / D-malate dehydrogenase